MTTERHDRIAGQLEEYVLGQLTLTEQRDVEAHVRACAICTRDLGEMTDALVLVAESIPAVEPPAALRARVLASVATEPQDVTTGIPAFGSTKVVAVRPRWLMAAAAAVVAMLGGALFVAESSRRGLADEVRRATAESTDLRQRLQRYSGQTDLALSILTASDMRELSLAGRENATAAAARAYWSPTRGLLVVADHLPAPPPGRIYQVWVIEGSQPMNAGLLGQESAGRGMLIAPPPRPGTVGAVTVAITDEPPGGLSAPSGTIHLAGSI